MAVDTLTMKAPASATAAAASAIIVASNEDREYLCITNLTTGGIAVYIAAGNPAVVGKGWPLLSAGASIEFFKGQNLTEQAIYAISASGNQAVAIQES